MSGPEIIRMRVEQLRQQTDAVKSERRDRKLPLPDYADFSRLDSEPPPERDWAVDQWIPRGSPTALYGRGGVGKSLLAQQIGTSVGTGERLFGHAVTRGSAVGFFCEDDKFELQRRQLAILNGMRRSAASTTDLYFEGRAGMDSRMVAFDRDRQLLISPFMDLVLRECERLMPTLVILDNVAQLFDGLENDRFQVTAFCNALTRLARDFNCAVLLLGHVGKGDGSEYSGSTGWDAAVRSRLLLTRQDDGTLELRRMKANYSALDSVRLEYRHGTFVELGSGSSGEASENEQRAADIVLAGLDTLTSRQVASSASPTAATYLPRLLRREGLLNGVHYDLACRALNGLIDAGALVPGVQLAWKKADRKWAHGLARRAA